MPKTTAISNIELALMGLLAEHPKHGYQIEQDIQARGMRSWAEIGFSSIYHLLNKLEASGLLESTRQETTDRPVRKVYNLTDKGWRMYSISVLERLSSPRLFTADYTLALGNLGGLPISDIIVALLHHYQTITAQIEQLQEKHRLDQSTAPLPWFVDALFDYSEIHMRAEAEFTASLLRKLDPTFQSGGQNA